MSLRIARIPYLNSAPFYLRLPEDVELLDLPPRQLGQAAREGAVDAGILSLCDILRLDGLRSLGDLGICVNGPAHSVLLFTRERPEDLRAPSIAVTGETSTSVRLMRLLLQHRYGIDAVRLRRLSGEPAAATDAGVLLIGDEALRAAAVGGLVPGSAVYGAEPMRLSGGPWSWALDLAAVWERWQGMPFVFAEWVAREQADAGDVARLEEGLHASLRFSESERDGLAQRHAGTAGLDAEAVRAYLDGFTYRIGPAERAAADRFRQLIEAEPWWQPGPVATTRQSE